MEKESFLYAIMSLQIICIYELLQNQRLYIMQITKEFYCEDSKSFYVFLYLLYKDGTIDILILLINRELNIVDGTIKALLTFRSPISMMMQISKCEVLF